MCLLFFEMIVYLIPTCISSISYQNGPKSANFQNFNIFIFHPILMQFCFLQNTHFNELCLHHETIKKSTYLFLENGFKVLPGPRLHSSPVPSVSGTTYYH
jgi:hypothetical protein